MDEQELFSGVGFHEFTQSRREQVLRKIESLPRRQVLRAPLEEIASELESQYKLRSPVLKANEIQLLEPPEEVTARESFHNRALGDHSVKAKTYIKFVVCVPFEGDASLLSVEPTSRQIRTGRPIRATVVESEIRLAYQEEVSSPDALERVYMQDVRLFETNAQRLASDVERFNADLPAVIMDQLEKRRAAAAKSESAIHSFKLPIKRREHVPQTYSIPQIRQRPRVAEQPKSETFLPEPTLDFDEYENILRIMNDMSLAMERSPRTFAALSEEDIRNFFLILLNGHYEGSATGETFNGEGKTDILIRHEGMNAFVAECKFWGGPKKMTKALDQLLSYVTWRDTKTAIVLFEKGRDLTAVTRKAVDAIQKHSHFKSEYEFGAERLRKTGTLAGFKLTHPGDCEKEVYLALMAYQVARPS